MTGRLCSVYTHTHARAPLCVEYMHGLCVYMPHSQHTARLESSPQKCALIDHMCSYALSQLFVPKLTVLELIIVVRCVCCFVFVFSRTFSEVTRESDRKTSSHSCIS